MRVARFVFVFMLTLSTQLLFAADVLVQNVRFEQKDEDIYVYYDLGGNAGKKHTVSIKLSDDGGRTFQLRPLAVEGAIGKGVQTGRSKRIIWHFSEDFPLGLSGDNFVFSVQAELQKGRSKLPWYLLGAAVAGGGTYFVIQSLGGDEPATETGSISFDIPGDL